MRLRIVRDDTDQMEIIKVRLNKVSFFQTFPLSIENCLLFVLKVPGQGLGLNIENSPAGVVIFGIVPGSEAAIDGALQPGDLILSANGADLRQATRDLVAQELRNSPGSTVQLEVGRKKKGTKSSTTSSSASSSNVNASLLLANINITFLRLAVVSLEDGIQPSPWEFQLPAAKAAHLATFLFSSLPSTKRALLIEC